MAGTAPIAAVLTLSPDNPCNTTLLNEDGKELYHVHTEHGSATTTFVKDADGQVLASLEWRDVLPDKVTLGQNSKGPMSIRDWLHTSLVPFYLKDDVDFKDDAGRKYKWRGNAPGRALELFSEDDRFQQPIAQFRKSRRDPASGTVAPAALLLTARAQEIRDTVVISFLFLEKSRRTNETTSQNVADVLSAPAMSAFTGSDYNVRDGGIS
ncbi:hypothetical protein C8Q70DRAFT_910873 [Cubamyces menziesii]|uniref:DUF6593 domain-containing protein n=1 Tax=Trametes cubensis TaxID=1111947 RepID=A0AAD7TLG0_9APHY|nr:hypothetical protein C8Q70DRAFT_910873 [Cubamyces menziesii]KAJ8468854.1 hypothetical protein ONZ51_g9378 [Trametes cubensis]